MRILITGIAGFIGSNFVHYYLRKYPEREIIGLDKLTYAGNMHNLEHIFQHYKKRFHFVRGDITDFNLLSEIFNKFDIDGVINFAAESHVDRSIESSQVFIETNVLGTHALLEVCKRSWYKNKQWKENKKFLQISTDEVYGSLSQDNLFSEKTPLDPRSPYSASKASADLIVKSFYDTYNMPVNISRCSNNYGPYQFPEKLIPLMISSCLSHKKLPIYGDGKQIRDWLHVDDHCKALDMIFEKAKAGETYNVGGNNERENIVVVSKIIEYLQNKTNDNQINDDLITYVEDRLGHDRRYAIDASKIKKDLGWKPLIQFEKGIKNTIDWYTNNRNWLNKIISKEYLEFNNTFYS